MSQTDFNQPKTKLALPAILCLAAFFIERSCFQILGQRTEVFNLSLLAVGIVVAWFTVTIAKPRLFYYAIVGVTVLYALLEAAPLVRLLSSGADFLGRLLFLAFSYPFLLAVFMIFRYRKAFLAEDLVEMDLLPLLGTSLLGEALLVIAGLIIRGGFHLLGFFPLLLQAVVGTGLLAKDRGFSLAGGAIWIGFILYNRFLAFRLTGTSALSMLTATVFAVTVVIVVNRFLKTGLTQNRLGDFMAAWLKTADNTGYSGNVSYTTTSKSCGNCGRTVSVSATAGQRCPYCGAYWGRENTRYK